MNNKKSEVEFWNLLKTNEEGNPIILEYFGHKFTVKEIPSKDDDDICLYRVESIYDPNVYGVAFNLDEAIERAKISARNYDT